MDVKPNEGRLDLATNDALHGTATEAVEFLKLHGGRLLDRSIEYARNSASVKQSVRWRPWGGRSLLAYAIDPSPVDVNYV